MRIGIITGSGTYALPGLEAGAPSRVATPFGEALVTEGRFARPRSCTSRATARAIGASAARSPTRPTSGRCASAGPQAILAVTVCGSLDPELALGTLVVFDDLHFPVNRLPDGSLCTLHTEPGAPGRGHWIFDLPFSDAAAPRAARGRAARPAARARRRLLRPRRRPALQHAEPRSACSCARGVTAVSQTAGPETVLAGEAKLPYALLGYATDYANGVKPEAPTPVEELIRLVEASTETFARTLAAAVPRVTAAPEPVGTHFSWD